MAWYVMLPLHPSLHWSRSTVRQVRNRNSVKLHTLQLTFVALHLNTDSPDWNDQGVLVLCNFVVTCRQPASLKSAGEHIHETVWEQIDNSMMWTGARKVLLIVPIVLYVFACFAGLGCPSLDHAFAPDGLVWLGECGAGLSCHHETLFAGLC